MDQSLVIPPADRHIAAAGIAQVLAATGVLWMKTQAFAWNAQGRESLGLALLLGAQADELRRALLPLSARIRALGFFAPAALADFIALSPVGEEAGVPVACEMADRLEKDHEKIVSVIRCIRPALEDIEDTATCLVLDRRLGAHESAAASFAAFRRDHPREGYYATSVRDALILPSVAGNGSG